jgi:tetratricopeptide (TPR) repeat protein
VPRLEALRRKQLVRPADADTVAGDSYQFEHILVRDAAYQALLKRERAQLHEAFVRWLEEAGRSEEVEELLGYHLEQAHRYLRDLGPLDAHGRALGTRAGRLLAAAGRRAFAREDMSAAAYLWRRAAALLAEHDPERLEVLPLLAEAFLDLGDFAVARAYVEEALGTARTLGDRRAEARASLVLALVRAHATGGTDRIAELLDGVQPALAIFAEVGDEAGAAFAWRMAAWAHGTVGRYGAGADAAERAMTHAERAGDDRQRRRAAGHYATASLYGPTPVDEAIPRCEAIVERERGDRRSVGLATLALARLHAMRGDADHARTLYRQAQAMLHEMGRSVVAASTSLDSAGVEFLAGDLEAAERELRRDQAQLSDMGERYLLASVAGELARVLCARGDLVAAWESSVMAEGLSAPDDVDAQVLWRSVRAQLLALRGEPEAGERLALDALGRLEDADAHGARADALLELAEVLLIAGRREQAETMAREALALHERKGNRVAAAAVRDRWRLGGATASGRSSSSAPRP